MSDDLVSSDLPVHLSLCADVKQHADRAAALAKSLLDEVESGPDSDAGLSFLELKNRLTAQYLADLSLVYLRRAAGKSLSGEPAVERLVVTRTVLEKMRPIEKKLKYQIDKAVAAAEGGGDADDPLRFRPNLGALAGKLGDDGEEDDDTDEDEEEGGTGKKASAAGNKKEGKYVAPKHVPAFFDEDDGGEARVRESEKREKKRLLSRGIIDDLKTQHLETPEEIYEHEDVMKKKQMREFKERVRFEEDNFTRLPTSKKTKHGRRQMSTMTTLGSELTSFGKNFFSAKSEGGGGGGAKRKKSFGGGKSFKKGSAKKRFKK